MDFTKVKRGNTMLTEMMVRAFMSDEEKAAIKKRKEAQNKKIDDDIARRNKNLKDAGINNSTSYKLSVIFFYDLSERF